ncbi:nucleoside hydrolase [Peptostreptococcus sp. D1]|uniref:nucleoside hydrolase n=1 Tax=Peptostreptococcus sp. D1 TaxID=72304 RepID=UPI0008E40753|nr:nucleoside hydrolase [Peptostreptococcus sp. D1]SFE60777.1 Inosine-uridine nucleoside N-ribohydrolase [Peptostreptococcus sp. D1]
MKRVIFDCDNTMGINNRDIDDGLALIYLLNRNDVDLLGITCTYGNDSVKNVFLKTRELLVEINRSEIPLVCGSGAFEMKNYVNLSFDKVVDECENDAAKFIVEQVNKNPKEISILATGSLQNIYDAYMIDNNIVDNIKEIVIMGGVTEPLYFGNKMMNELNFTVCNEGAYIVLKNFKNISILTGNNCMKSQFGTGELEKSKFKSVEKYGKNAFIIEKIEKWMGEFKELYGYEAIVLWDVIAAIYLLEPELFKKRLFLNKSNVKSLSEGRLIVDDLKEFEESKKMCYNITRDENIINIPEIINGSNVNENLILTIF